MKTGDNQALTDLVDAVADSTIEDTTTLTENDDSVKFERIAEITDDAESTEIPRDLTFDENGEIRTDVDGNEFDIDKHVVDDNGHPKLTGKGKLRKKRGRKAGSISTTTAAQKAQKIAVSEKEKYRAVGAGAANALISLGIMLGGEDFTPVINQHVDEKQNLESAFTDWAETQDVEDIPPNLGLAIVLGAYLLPRLTMPKQVSKLKLAKEWLKMKFFKKPKIVKYTFDPNKESKED
ncbi:coil containing protein [Vibrio phage 1.080.O._10N.286.48.A4]|uniref:Coil containing protein n=2 Tax=Autolykiviridae TaxID=2184034 RepID=A0A2I7QWE8_9VIRU|nr:coil containing protein [Vibrio phage 1.080.O._10N.286.48.A4]AUR85722.1 coil containing protein [Vibrio phage 1.080.O._10N.286.48.A4]AUR90309.1 coil containing protein [Vibrio phage 1.141.A._10N.261.49.B3]